MDNVGNKGNIYGSKDCTYSNHNSHNKVFCDSRDRDKVSDSTFESPV